MLHSSCTSSPILSMVARHPQGVECSISIHLVHPHHADMLVALDLRPLSEEESHLMML